MENSNSNFAANTDYKHNFIGDSELWVIWTVIRRTAKTVWLKSSNGETSTCRVDTFEGVEYVHPMGKYSMAPILKASRLA